MFQITSIEESNPPNYPEACSQGWKWYCVRYEGLPEEGLEPSRVDHWFRARNQKEAKSKGEEVLKSMNLRAEKFYKNYGRHYAVKLKDQVKRKAKIGERVSQKKRMEKLFD